MAQGNEALQVTVRVQFPDEPMRQLLHMAQGFELVRTGKILPAGGGWRVGTLWYPTLDLALADATSDGRRLLPLEDVVRNLQAGLWVGRG